jgi:acetyl esterase/lipase
MPVRSLLLFLWLAASSFAQAPAAPALPDSVSMEANISYDQYKETVLDIMQPKAPAVGKRPGVIVIHGGGWTGGTKESQTIPFCLRYVEKGFVCANVEYRLAKAALAPAAVNDALKAAEWFFKNANKYNVDRDRIVVTGGSAGGHLALMAGMTPKSARLGPTSDIAAVINFYGITEVADQLEGPNMRKYAVTWLPPDKPGSMDLAVKLSPMTYVRKGVPPILTIHGDADETVPYEHGVRLTKALRDVGADAEMISIPQGKHGFPAAQLDVIYAKHIFPFLAKRGILR